MDDRRTLNSGAVMYNHVIYKVKEALSCATPDAGVRWCNEPSCRRSAIILQHCCLFKRIWPAEAVKRGHKKRRAGESLAIKLRAMPVVSTMPRWAERPWRTAESPSSPLTTR